MNDLIKTYSGVGVTRLDLHEVVLRKDSNELRGKLVMLWQYGYQYQCTAWAVKPPISAIPRIRPWRSNKMLYIGKKNLIYPVERTLTIFLGIKRYFKYNITHINAQIPAVKPPKSTVTIMRLRRP